MIREAFRGEVYPEGCRCACCRVLFEDRQLVVRHFLGETWTYLTCEPCAESGAPLCDDHPLRDEATVVLRADGSVGSTEEMAA